MIDQALGALLVAVQGEGDAGAVEQQVGFAPALQQLLFRGVGQPASEFPIMRAAFAASIVHLVVKHACHAGLLVVTNDGELAKPVPARGSIAAVEGVDGVFIGPADLSAAMGHRGNPGHPEVQAAIEDAIRRIRAAGKAAGILSADEALARRYLELGCAFVAVGVDTSLLMRSLRELAGRFKGGAPAPSVSSSVYG